MLIYGCEFAGTAVMMLLGVSAVTVMWAYLVERGELRVTRDGLTLAELGPGAWVGEMSLLLDEPRSATVTALTGVQLRRITKESFGRLLAEDPARTQELLRQLAARVRESNRQLAGGR